MTREQCFELGQALVEQQGDTGGRFGHGYDILPGQFYDPKLLAVSEPLSRVEGRAMLVRVTELGEWVTKLAQFSDVRFGINDASDVVKAVQRLVKEPARG